MKELKLTAQIPLKPEIIRLFIITQGHHDHLDLEQGIINRKQLYDPCVEGRAGRGSPVR